MSQQTYVRVSGGIFAVVAVLHVLRFILQWDMVIGGWTAPIWLSVVGILVAGYLAWSACRLGKSS